MNIDSIKLDEADAKALRDLNNHRAGVEAFVQTMTTAGEQRMADLIAEGQALWQRLATKYQLDVNHVQYALDPTGKNELKITGARFE